MAAGRGGGDVHLYVGRGEHAVLYLLYACVWHKIGVGSLAIGRECM